MLTSVARRRKRLRWLRLKRFRFQGGKCLRIDGAPDEGIQFLGLDIVGIRLEDRLYLIPYTALLHVRGGRRAQPNPLTPQTLRAEVKQWVDPLSTIWHYFITRNGRLKRGAVLGVTAQGVRLRPQTSRKPELIRWGSISAAVEILE